MSEQRPAPVSTGFIERLDRLWSTAWGRVASWRMSLLLGRLRNLWRLPAVRRQHGEVRLNLGCGPDCRAGFVNADLGLAADLHVDARRRFPFADGTFRLIYTESMLEHLDRAEGLNCLRECHRTLAVGGILRIGTPDMAYQVACYRDPDGLGASRPPMQVPPRYGQWETLTRAQRLQLLFHEYGHRYLYDRERLSGALAEAGFDQVEYFEPGVGSCELTAGLERREAGLLVVEATKRSGGRP